MLSKFCAERCEKGRVASVQPVPSRWVGRFFLAAVLLLGTYIRRMKLSPSAVNESNSTMATLLSLTLHSFPIQQPSEWPSVTVGVSVAIYLSCALGRTVHVFLAYRAVMKLLCPTQQQFGALPLTVLILWLTCGLRLLNKNVRHWMEDALVEGNGGSTLSSWALLVLLAALYCMSVSLLSLLQFILMKVNFLSLLLHVQLVTCLQNARIPTKYVLVVKIRRFM